jgi:hypothetical protein
MQDAPYQPKNRIEENDRSVPNSHRGPPKSVADSVFELSIYTPTGYGPGTSEKSVRPAEKLYHPSENKPMAANKAVVGTARSEAGRDNSISTTKNFTPRAHAGAEVGSISSRKDRSHDELLDRASNVRARRALLHSESFKAGGNPLSNMLGDESGTPRNRGNMSERGWDRGKNGFGETLQTKITPVAAFLSFANDNPNTYRSKNAAPKMVATQEHPKPGSASNDSYDPHKNFREASSSAKSTKRQKMRDHFLRSRRVAPFAENEEDKWGELASWAMRNLPSSLNF